LARWHLDRRYQRGHHSRQPAKRPLASSPAVLGAGDVTDAASTPGVRRVQPPDLQSCERHGCRPLWRFRLFRPRFPFTFLQPQGAPGALSFYDTAPLRATLGKLIDFDLINNPRAIRLSLGAVNIRSANFVYFDNSKRTLSVDHVMASAARPPGFPPVAIEGEYFWDGGLVSNTPLSYLLEDGPREDTLAFQVDLFSALGQMPRDIWEVSERCKDITYSSRTRLNTDHFRQKHRLRRAVAYLYEHLPDDIKERPEIKALYTECEHHVVSIVHLIYRRKNYENQFKDYEFSQASMREHWQAGLDDAHRTLRHQFWLEPVAAELGVRVSDVVGVD
jgi:NTE family protein